MKGKRLFGIGLAAAVLLALLAGLALAQEPASSPLTAAFTYQGRLKSDGNPYTGPPCNFQFGLWAAESGGAQVGTTLTIPNVGLADGYFTVILDWGGDAFQGEARWLEIAVQCPGEPGYTTLTPRQLLSAAPFALYSLSADPLVMQQRVDGTCASSYAIREVKQDGSVTCEWVGGGGGGAWLLTGNSDTTPGTNFVGTTDDKALVFKVYNQRAFRLESTPGSPNVIGGISGNWAYSGVYGASIGGGGDSTLANVVTDIYGTVGGGVGNQAGDAAGTVDDRSYCTVGGGRGNTASGDNSTVGGGWYNEASSLQATIGGGQDNLASGGWATIGGGKDNATSADSATVGGGEANTAVGMWATVSGGYSNSASGASFVGGGEQNHATGAFATVSGGGLNTASGSYYSTVGGGTDNTASGLSATVPGGDENVAQGDYSFAAGRRAKAYHTGCFVWGDSYDGDVTCDYDDRWVARSSGGVYFYTSTGFTSGSYLDAGGNYWNAVSDRATKENFSPANGRAILETLASLPVQEYNLKSQDDAIRHVGLVAQDFAAFGYGESDKAINMGDADGVAMAAIQALYAENQQLRAQVASLDSRVTALEKSAQGGQAAQSGNRLPVPWLVAGGLVLAGCGALAARRGPGGGR